MRDKLNFFQSISFTLACMVGTGIFTSLGFQLQSMDDVGWIMLLWIAGGLVAFLGSLIYASLGTAMPGNGGEVLYLSALIHPVFGYISAWVSLVAGFAAPAAASALTAASYLGYFYPGFPQKIGASIIVFALTAIHLKSISVSGKSQFYLTLVKIFIIVVFIIMCFGLGKMNISANNQNLFFSKKLDLSAFGVSLLYVLYTYSGWNAFGYFAGHVENPSRNIPRIALAAVVMVFLIYMLLNAGFLAAAPAQKLKGNAEAGAVASEFILGQSGGKIFTSILGLLLISSTSAFLFTGPRVFLTENQLIRFPDILKKKNANQIPIFGMWIQLILALIFIWWADVDFILKYSGFSLSFFTLLSVWASLKIPPEKRVFRVPFAPFTHILFIGIHVFIYFYSFSFIKYELMVFASVMVFGSALYYVTHHRKNFGTVLLIFPFFILSCVPSVQNNSDNSNSVKKISDTAKNIPLTDKLKTENGSQAKCIPNTNVDEWAKTIAGMNKLNTRISQYHSYRQYEQRLEKKWKILDSTKLISIKRFEVNEIRPLAGENYTLFYPFSGADFLYAHYFFPGASKMILCALEPAGAMPDMKEFLKSEDSLREYLNRVEQSLFAIMRFSFFKTKNMKTDFADDELNGVVHLMSLFMMRCGYDIAELDYFRVDSGKITLLKDRKNADGIRWRICNGAQNKEVYYYRADLSNQPWKKHENNISILTGNTPFVSFVKSASYLMHEKNFSSVRDFILKNSILHVQDESGIPIRYVKPDIWERKLYGEYHGPIPLFKNCFQKDLDSLYKHTQVNKLGFGIGYNYKDRNSCFMIFRKK